MSLSLPLSFPACPMSQTPVCPSRGNDRDVFSFFSQSVSLSVCCAVRVHQVHIRCVSQDTLDAREEEASTLMRFGLVDAYACAHLGRATDHDPHGWTWGFPSSKAKAHTNTPQQNSKRQKAQTFDDEDQAQSCDRRRRIDRIHIPYSMESFISECYPTFLADSDHKLVLVGLQCPSAPAATRRKRCPVGFLNDDEEV